MNELGSPQQKHRIYLARGQNSARQADRVQQLFSMLRAGNPGNRTFTVEIQNRGNVNAVVKLRTSTTANQPEGEPAQSAPVEPSGFSGVSYPLLTNNNNAFSGTFSDQATFTTVPGGTNTQVFTVAANVTYFMLQLQANSAPVFITLVGSDEVGVLL